MKTTYKIYIPILLATALAVGVLLGSFLNYPAQQAGLITGSSNKSKLNKLLDFIDSEYVDNVNTDSIVDLTVNSILEKLDPHSVYIAKNEMEEVAQSMKGDFVGIGVNFYMYKDSVAIIKPIPGGPSDKAGLKAGDRILYAGNYKLFGRKLANDTLFSKLKGEEGSKLTLTIYRKSDKKKFKVNVTRDVVPIKSVDAFVMVAPKMGYIKVNRFAETTYTEFHSALESLKKQGATSLIVDLRDNGGGYLEKAVEIADEFLKDKQLIVKTKNKKERVDVTDATAKGIFEDGQLYVLINENSASASEILAGAIQDNDRGTIVGRRSFGKGLVQREMPLGDGSAVRLTVARYYTPSGRSIQRSYANGDEEYFNDFQKRYESGELYAADSIKVADTLKFKTLKGRTVYGGGGIVPDVFVPLEGKHGDEAISMVMQSGITGYFVFEQLDKDRKELEGLTADKITDEVTSTDKYFKAFNAYLLKNGLVFKLEAHKDKVKRYLAAEFARQLLSEEDYYEMILKEDNMVKAVLEKQ
ncbi:PDZ domain-containing protein [Flavobacterium sp. Sd200]|uniref:S41 family peptidase n=1 Tax=Flavobacterium sp. Sd200 TaxID=2692211 RepID=UPI00136C6717|nr:S41 family peptidase [Flavobacterium sp. Sd200]MXN91228.1 PDZ domain-containing protein [Flavobacterium sp. Sd200]